MTTNTALAPDAVAVLRENFDGSNDILKAVVADFRESVARLHGRIRAGIETGDAADMANAAHSLKSNAATMGATVMADAMREIERVGRTGSTDGCAVLLAQSEDGYQAIDNALDGLTGEDQP